MEVKIVENLVTTKPKVGFYCNIEGVKLRIIEIEGGIATMENGNQYNVTDLKPFVIRYTAVIGDKSFDVEYSDYGRIYSDQVVEGYLREIHRNVKEEDLVRVCSIDIIDAHAMHDVRDRVGVIIRPIPGKKFEQEFEVQLRNNRKLLTLKRKDFMLTERADKKMYFHPRCTECSY